MQVEEKKPSAKDLALQSMGSHATAVRGLMQKTAAEDKSVSWSRNQSQDNLSRTLSLIREEDDGEEHPRVKFAKGHESAKADKETSVPRVVVSTV